MWTGPAPQSTAARDPLPTGLPKGRRSRGGQALQATATWTFTAPRDCQLRRGCGSPSPHDPSHSMTGQGWSQAVSAPGTHTAVKVPASKLGRLPACPGRRAGPRQMTRCAHPAMLWSFSGMASEDAAQAKGQAVPGR